MITWKRITLVHGFADYKSECGRFVAENTDARGAGVDADGFTIGLARNLCGFNLMDNGVKVGFFKKLKDAKAYAETLA
jgi:hypothetical protein